MTSAHADSERRFEAKHNSANGIDTSAPGPKTDQISSPTVYLKNGGGSPEKHSDESYVIKTACYDVFWRSLGNAALVSYVLADLERPIGFNPLSRVPDDLKPIVTSVFLLAAGTPAILIAWYHIWPHAFPFSIHHLEIGSLIFCIIIAPTFDQLPRAPDQLGDYFSGSCSRIRRVAGFILPESTNPNKVGTAQPAMNTR